jgi:hypothetical protein
LFPPEIQPCAGLFLTTIYNESHQIQSTKYGFSFYLQIFTNNVYIHRLKIFPFKFFLIHSSGSALVPLENKGDSTLNKGINHGLGSKDPAITGGFNGNSIEHEGIVGGRSPFRTSDQTLEPEDEAIYLWFAQRHSHHRSSEDSEAF